MNKINEFLDKKNVKISPKIYLVDALSAMAQGLFCSLLIGTILNTLGSQFNIEIFKTPVFYINDNPYTVGAIACSMIGPAMSVAIGYSLKAPALVLFSLVPVGYATNTLGGASGPLAVFFVSIIATEFGKIVSKETKIDILITPFVTVIVGIGIAALIAKPIGLAAFSVGNIIMWATNLQPILMGIIVSAVVGIALTLPISSAAICAALGLTGLAGGAALAGCCAQMIGFAVMSFKENGIGGLISQGIGTSMLQMPNIIKNPKIWIPPIVASVITGPIATCVFNLEMNGAAVSAGMGTCGFVGQIGVYTGWVENINNGLKESITIFDWTGLILISFILPAIISLFLCIFLKKIKWIKKDDLKLN